MITQEEKVLTLLQLEGSISDKHARDLAIFHLPVIISKLRKRDFEIKTLTTVNKDGRFTTYQLIK